MHHHRPTLPPPARRRPGLEAALSVLLATVTGTLLAAALVHWWSCPGVC